MKKIVDKAALHNLISSIKIDVGYGIANVEYRAKILKSFEESLNKKILEISNKYDHISALELINDFYYIDDRLAVNYYIYSDYKITLNKNEKVCNWKYFPYAIQFYIHQYNECIFTSIHGDFIECDNRSIPRHNKKIV